MKAKKPNILVSKESHEEFLEIAERAQNTELLQVSKQVSEHESSKSKRPKSRQSQMSVDSLLSIGIDEKEKTLFGDRRQIENESRIVAYETAMGKREMKRLHQFIAENNMTLSKAPKMPFTLNKLRERHRKLIRNIFATENKKDLDYKNYDSTDSDLVAEE